MVPPKNPAFVARQRGMHMTDLIAIQKEGARLEEDALY
jgi:hypothetical protein